MQETFKFSKKTFFIALSLFLVIFTCLLLIVTINNGYYDLKVSEILVHLRPNNRYSDSFFGRFIEVTGETPVWFLFGIIFIGFIYYFHEGRTKTFNKIIMIVFQVISLIFFTLAFYRIAHNWSMYYGGELSSWNHLFNYTLCFNLISGFIFMSLFELLIFNLKLEPKQVLKFCLVGLIALALGEIIVHAIKPLVSRNRYRGMWVLGGDFSYFTPWFQKGSLRLDLKLAIPDDFKSFPSGHTASAAATYLLMLLPMYFPRFNTKVGKACCFSLPILVTGLVAFFRIYVGAHFFSDVLFGGTIMFVVIFLTYFTTILIKKNA